MVKVSSFQKNLLIILLIVGGVTLGLTVGGAAWAYNRSNSTNSSSNLGVVPGFSGVSVPGKVPPPKGRITPPSDASATGAAAGVGLNNSIPACGGATSCHPIGVSPTNQAPFSQADFRVTSEYSTSYGNQDMMIYAGESLSAPTSGSSRGKTTSSSVIGSGLRIIVGSNPNAMQQFLTPGSLGRLTITSVNANIVNLRDQNGTALTFDLATDVYSL